MRRLERTIEEVGWTRDVPRLASTARVGDALAVMKREIHDCVLVIEGESLAGIFTSRDFLNRVVAERRDPSAVTLAEVMTRVPRTLRPRDPVAFAINWMAIEGFRNVPIVDDGHVLGVLTVWNVMRVLDELFAEIDATPRARLPQTASTGVVAMVDLGGDQ